MNVWSYVSGLNLVTVLIALVFGISVLQGLLRGATSSAKRLALMVTEGAATLLGLFLSWELTEWASPQVQLWLASRTLSIPPAELGFWEQLYYTGVTGLRDFSLLRFALLFVIDYGLIKQLLYRLIDPFVDSWLSEPAPPGRQRTAPSFLSSLVGGVIGAVTGAGRSLLMIALLFILTTLLPQTPMTSYIGASELYRKGATEVIRPVTGDFIEQRLPVFTRQVEEEFASILQRKYEVVDAHIPGNIADAAKEITAKGRNDEEKAKLLYQWVGTRVKYDWEKVRLYEEQRIWKEQTPEETFATKAGVCIDFSRLYAVMARSIGLDVKVVTGLGYDGRGGYGPHAWNEVYLAEDQKWVPLDSTWVASGGNWFNPPNFQETHIKEV
ncbi:transglutaminase-like domain-containing protein [Paenibacillus mucilaginosus]|uniref:Transglutaminase-like enzyme, putative cysteine protease n=1 Tax=Paenibacillus mucilaginosus (strain KNP414) TaxID=1036673 RepID=F8FFL9_PAEMK|nr:transglutaminase-like domain-containing protein [Paenibacillus mucilaginosus]AEI42247.1 transglutaminase-like enzyme, putative cysteine protease [Paenibacillus mucilaginosus KNP414]MCG7214209.1 transglutaminase-like domain-containing protein [Paenibacillus mucilaginosus]WDM28723.1 transglutaminase domain-containing protein [Paenibacillus mucilaginosus]